MRRMAFLIAALLVLTAPQAWAGRRAGLSSRPGPGVRSAPRITKPPATGGKSRNYCWSCERDTKGKIKRSPRAREEFKRSEPCPSTGRGTGACPGYDIDHRVPLSKGGPDEPGNMQWLPKEQHKEKTRREAR